ncbi:hypothetical protein ACG83_29720 [Frankia sp. R43]|uniref:zinc-binding dehydrogenase n=1 Tax=Frankia sp. R43 TaxID=269536 RepID=UPI0006CA518D|nr:zinc-binding dehydrogenase [Frankia sp. R43]KPM52507.1 hypothetical protein ACG83_29720 [Frankia sp. R43]
MLAVRLTRPDPHDPLSSIEVAEHRLRSLPAGWTTVTLRTASLNRSDIWAMRATTPPAALPVVLGADGAGVDEDGNEVIIYPILADRRRGHGDEMHDPQLRMLSQGVDGTLARQVVVPRHNLVPKPPELPWEAAASLGTAWLTAYRMLFGPAEVRPGDRVLIQGAGGGVSTALIRLARAAGAQVWVTSTDPGRGARAVAELGAHAAFAVGEPLPEPVDAAMDTVGDATFGHSLRSLRPGGRLVTAGATAGATTQVDLGQVFTRSLSIHGSAMGTPEQLARLARLCATGSVAPVIDSVWPLSEGRTAIARMLDGEHFGKIVIRCDQ